MADTFLALIDANEDKIRSLLPKYMTPERFFTLARLIEKDANLRACTPQSLFECVMKAAQCGLEIGTVDQHAFIIPYKNEATFQPSYRGLIFRLVNAGVVANMYADVVRANDPEPEITSGTNRTLTHKPLMIGDRGPVVGAYSVATLPNGLVDFEYLYKDDLDAIEKAALRISGGKPSPAWQYFKAEMQKKSAIRRHAKRLQGDRRGLISDDEATRLDLAFQATRRDVGEEEPPDDVPRATDGTEAPTPRRVKVEVVKEDRLLNTDEQDELINGWIARDGKASQLSKFLQVNFQVDDMAKIKVSQVSEVVAAMDKEHGVSA